MLCGGVQVHRGARGAALARRLGTPCHPLHNASRLRAGARVCVFVRYRLRGLAAGLVTAGTIDQCGQYDCTAGCSHGRRGRPRLRPSGAAQEQQK